MYGAQLYCLEKGIICATGFHEVSVDGKVAVLLPLYGHIAFEHPVMSIDIPTTRKYLRFVKKGEGAAVSSAYRDLTP